MTLRALLLLAGLAGLVASLALDRPERFSVTMPCGLVVVVVGTGAVAADAIPLRRVALACSALTVACGLLMLGRTLEVPATAAIAGLQAVAVAAQPGRLGRYVPRVHASPPGSRRASSRDP